LKFHIVQYFLQIFSVVLMKVLSWIENESTNTHFIIKRKESQRENSKLTGLKWKNWVECSFSFNFKQWTPPKQVVWNCCCWFCLFICFFETKFYKKKNKLLNELGNSPCLVVGRKLGHCFRLTSIDPHSHV
jgi:hypothetical protein